MVTIQLKQRPPAGKVSGDAMRRRETSVVDDHVPGIHPPRPNGMHYANDIILMTDPEERLFDANERAVQAYGYTRDELGQMSNLDLRAPEVRRDFKGQTNPKPTL